MSNSKKINNKELSKILAQYKMTVEEAREWLGESKCKPGKKNNSSQSDDIAGNVLFYPAQDTEKTKVCLKHGSDATELKNVTRVLLDYNPELGFPVLTLEIANPKIVHETSS